MMEKKIEKLKEQLGKGWRRQRLWRTIALELRGISSPEADEIREWLRYDKGRLRGGINAKIINALGLPKSKIWFYLRQKIDRWWPWGFYLPCDLLLSYEGISCPKKWELIAEIGDLCPAETLLCLRGDTSPEAEKIRAKYQKDRRLKWAYEKSKEGT